MLERKELEYIYKMLESSRVDPSEVQKIVDLKLKIISILNDHDSEKESSETNVSG